MAIDLGGKFKSLAFTQVGTGGPTSPIDVIQNADTNEEIELAEFRLGLARVKTYFAGEIDAFITVETPKLGKALLFKKGQVYTGVELTQASTEDSDGNASGGEITYTLSKAIVSEVGSITKDNADSSPVSRSVTFRLHRAPGDASDPTYTIAESV